MIPLETFQSDIKSHWASIVTSDRKGNPGRQNEAIQRSFEIFNETRQSSLPFILLGPNRLRENVELKTNFKLITCPLKKSQKNKTPTTGALLGERQWSLLINDSFILGAIQADKDVFLLMEKMPSKKLLWDIQTSTLTTLGRELTLLQIAGYKRIATSSTDHGIMFKRCCSGCDFTLASLWKELKEIKQPNQLTI